MTNPTPLIQSERVPLLDLPTSSSGRYVLRAKPAQRFDLLVFYRGLHCPVCAKYPTELERLAPEFEKRGVRSVAISTEGEKRALEVAEKVNARLVSLTYDLSLSVARTYGLYSSQGRDAEPALFNEPGVFLVRPDRTFYYGAAQTMTFARPA